MFSGQATLRYGVGSLTGWPTMSEGGRTRSGSTPPTVWYVHDRCRLSEPVAVFDHEHEARKRAFDLNAEERRWEKEET